MQVYQQASARLCCYNKVTIISQDSCHTWFYSKEGHCSSQQQSEEKTKFTLEAPLRVFRILDMFVEVLRVKETLPGVFSMTE